MTKRILTGNAVGGTIATATDRAITLYVRTDGNDNNTGLVDSAGGALLTIQAAINKIPTVVKHQVTVNIGAGNFAGFFLADKMMESWVGQTTSQWPITIQGAAWANFTPATGTGSGTSDGGSTTTLSDSTQSWTAHELRGKVVYVNSGYNIIRDNDATSFETIGVSGATMSGKAYVLKDWATVLTGPPSPAINPANGTITISNVGGTRAAYMGILVDKIKAISSGTGAALWATTSDFQNTYCSYDGNGTAPTAAVSYNRNIRLQNIYACNCGSMRNIEIFANLYVRELKNIFTYGGTGQGIYVNGAYVSSADYIYTDSHSNDGLILTGTTYYYCAHSYAKSCGGSGIFIDGTPGECHVVGAVIDACTGPGIRVNCTGTIGAFTGWGQGTSNVNLAGTITLTNNANGGIVVGPNATVRLTACTGTGNTGYGITCAQGGKVFITSATTVTGATNNVNIDGAAKTYAADFAADNSYVTDATTGSIIKRTDAGTF